MQSSEEVNITIESNYIYFDGKENNKALIFYQGAKVDNIAYSRLMYELAENGIDCFLLNVPYRFALLGLNMPDKIINNYNYEEWYIGGHSLGGVVASMYASNHNNINGLILLASYPCALLNDNIKVISIYGSNDKVLDKTSYNNAVWPLHTQEYIIEGGNHSGFGNYGEQKGDGKALISNTLQQDETIEIIVNELFSEISN